MFTYQLERPSECQAELEGLLTMHWQELARHKDEIRLSVDWDAYKALELADILHMTTVREDGKLIGYIVIFVAPSLHYKEHVMAKDDVLFLHPDYRGTRAFISLLKFTETYLEKLGVENFYIGVKLSHDFGSILERLGYIAIDKTYEKRL